MDDKKNPPSSRLLELYENVEKTHTSFIGVLREAVAIRSLSQDEQHFSDVTQMLKFCDIKLKELGASTELITTKNLRTASGVNFPPILLGSLFVDEELKTICVYGHVDVPSTSSEEDSYKDFDLTIKNGRIYGRGVSRSKGPLFCWFNALMVYVSTKIPIPVNIKFVIEGVAELHSPTLNDVVTSKRDFFKDVEYFCFTNDKKIENDRPCLRYGYRGVVHFSLDIRCGERDMDSGTHGGAFNQPLIDAVYVVSRLVDKHDKLVQNMMGDAPPLSRMEKDIVEKYELNVEELKRKIGVKRLRHKEIASRVLIHKTRLPCVSIHGFEMTGMDPDSKNPALVPYRTIAKFSIRLVPEKTAFEIETHVDEYVRKVWKEHKSANSYKLRMDMAVDPWREDPTSGHFKAAAKAMKLVYGKDPLYICDGYSLPAVSIVKAICPQSSSLILSLSETDDLNDESMSVESYMNGVKVSMAYMCYINEL